MSLTSILALSLVLFTCRAEREAANPIRKVVTMLQSMQTRVKEEGVKEKDQYEKFICYCKTSGGTLGGSIAAAESKIEAVTANLESAKEQKTTTDAKLVQSQEDRSAAKAAMAEATAIRNKEAAAFAVVKSDDTTNIDAMTKAVAALENGMAGGFLQTRRAQVLKKLVVDRELAESDRQEVLAFLSGTAGTEYAPQSGKITGILKQMIDEMTKDLSDATKVEMAAIKAHQGLMDAKKKEVSALQAGIEAKMTKSGNLGVSIAQMQNDLEDTGVSLKDDQKFKVDLEKGCATKTSEWEERSETRSQELAALADTIKVLNDDDALELFKSTLPGSGSSFLQFSDSAASMRTRALAAIKMQPNLDFIALALHGKQAGFGKVVDMIDTMTATLHREQQDDDNKKEYCGMQFDESDDKKKALERSVSDADSAIASAKDGIAALAEEIKDLEAGIAALDKSVSDATAQRKQESKLFSELMASDTDAKKLLAFAKNRLNKFYQPGLYKAPEPRKLARDDQIIEGMGGTVPTVALGGIAGTGIGFAQISMHMTLTGLGAPPPPPATFGAYATKTADNNGVIAMMDLLIADLDKEMTEAQTEEKDAQADYAVLMKDSAGKRAADSKLVSDKTSSKAGLEGDLQDHQAGHSADTKELMATEQYIASLHSECDWLLKYFDVRKDARAGEVDSLSQAKAVLSGAEYSLLQEKTRQRKHIRAHQ